MSVYTRTGDKGDTQVYADDVLRMRKNSDVLECYGTLDELNAQVGMLACDTLELGDFNAILTDLQRDLFQIGFAISANTTLTDGDVDKLENLIDELEQSLPAQTHFILPGGSRAAAQAHICRTVARRAERRLVALLDQYEVPPVCLTYLNRVSDYFFVFARHLNHSQNIEDVRV